MQLSKHCVFQIPGGDWYVETRTGFEGPFRKYSEAAEFYSSLPLANDQSHVPELARLDYDDRAPQT